MTPSSFRSQIHVSRRSIIQPLVIAFLVVEPKVLPQARLSGAYIRVVLDIDLFVLHAPPQPFHEDVVEHPAPAIHADSGLGSEQRRLELRAGKLRTLVGVEYLG